MNLYGTPEGVNPDLFKQVTRVGKMASQMNLGYLDGTAFRGRILVAAEAHPLSGVKVNTLCHSMASQLLSVEQAQSEPSV